MNKAKCKQTVLGMLPPSSESRCLYGNFLGLSAFSLVKHSEFPSSIIFVVRREGLEIKKEYTKQ